MVKKKGAREMNPADAERKRQRAKEIARNKKERKFQRDAHALTAEPEKIKEELQEIIDYEEEGKMNPTVRLKKRALQMAFDVAVKKKKDATIRQGSDSVSFGNQHGHGVPDRTPEDSVYYHPTKNPSGAPPPGKPQRYRTALPPAAAAHQPQAAGLPVPAPPPLPKGPAPHGIPALMPPPPAAPPLPAGAPPTTAAAPLPPPPGPPTGASNAPLPPPPGPPPGASAAAAPASDDDENDDSAAPGTAAPPPTTAALPPPPGPPPGFMPPPPGHAHAPLPPPALPPPGMMMGRLPPPNMPPPGYLPPPLGPPPGLPPGMMIDHRKEVRPTIAAASTVISRPRAQDDKVLTSMVPASVRVRRDAAPLRARAAVGARAPPVVGPGFGLMPAPAPVKSAGVAPKQAVPSGSGTTVMDKKYQDFLSDMAELGAF